MAREKFDSGEEIFEEDQVLGYGDKIRMARLARKMTQGELGRAVGRKAAAISVYESEDVAPQVDLLARIAVVLDLEPAALMPDRASVEAYFAGARARKRSRQRR